MADLRTDINNDCDHDQLSNLVLFTSTKFMLASLPTVSTTPQT